MRRIRGGRLAKAMLFGAITTFLGVAVNAALDYARQDWTNPIGIAVVAVLAGVTGIIPLLQEDPPPAPAPPAPDRGPATGRAPVPPGSGQPQRYDWPPGTTGPAARGGTRVPLAAAALVLLVLCGGGAAAVTFGVKTFGAYLTGQQDGVSILVAPATGSAGPLTLTVDEVEQTRNFTRVHLVGTNSGQDIPKLVAGFCQLTGDDGTTFKPDPFRSDWPEDVTPGENGVSGWLVFEGHLPAGTTSATLTFTTIFNVLGEPSSIAVDDIQLQLPE